MDAVKSLREPGEEVEGQRAMRQGGDVMLDEGHGERHQALKIILRKLDDRGP